MKKIIIILVAASIGISACKNKDEFVIDGKLVHSGGLKMVKLYQANQLIDSAVVNSDGEFRFKRSGIDPDFYGIEAGEKSYQLIANNGDEISFEADLQNKVPVYKVDGSEASEKVIAFNAIAQKYQGKFQELQSRYEQMVAANPASKETAFNTLTPAFQKVVDDFGKEALDFGNDNKDNLAGFYAVSSIDQGTPSKYEAEMIRFAEDIKPLYPKNKAVQEFSEKMIGIKPVSIGQTAPDFELPDANGVNVKLSGLRGKYVLLDFWASWCGPCRAENPNVVKAFTQFKDKGFTVLGVSLDSKKDAWLAAVKQDGLAWTQVSDLKFWDSAAAKLYKVDAIPSSFLLDRSGKIVGKNLKGAELTGFLNDHLTH